MANNGIPAYIARLNDLTNRIRGGDNLSQQDAYEILYFTQAEDVPGDNTPEVVRVLELIQRMQKGPILNEDEINEVLRLRKIMDIMWLILCVFVWMQLFRKSEQKGEKLTG